MENLEYLLGAMLGVFVLIILAALAVGILYLLTLKKLLDGVRPENQRVSPGNVWLLLIPIFNLVYAFIIYPKISDSVAAEFAARNYSADGDFGKVLGGMVMPILGVLSMLPVIGGIAGLANLVVWIIYWVKMSGYKKRLQASY